MIHVDRPADPGSIPKSLFGPGCAAEKERERMLRHLEEKGSLDGFTFSVYKNEDVKEALTRLFHGKCAYCEVQIPRQPPDVEHYRPKGGYYDGPDFELKKPGYFWLAAEWTNLLPSCIDCNRGRKQQVEGGGRRLAGKENHFPLRDPLKRAKKQGEEAHEEAILLDPCVDRPEMHLEFPEKGEGVVRPAQRADGTNDPRGSETIEILGLDAVPLIQHRQERLHFILRDLVDARETIDALPHAANDAMKAFLTGRLKELRGQLEDYQKPGAPYAGMARQIIAKVPIPWPE